MTTQEIYKLASELSEKEVTNILNYWEANKESKQIESFKSLVRLGDSKPFAMATTIAKKYNSVDNFQTYYNAYSI